MDVWIYVIDVAGGDKIPRKCGPGITRSDLLLINKVDLAPNVGASLEVMERDARKMRGDRPFFFTNLRDQVGLDPVVDWLEKQLKVVPSEVRHYVVDAHQGAYAIRPHDQERHPDHGHHHR